MTGIIFWDMDHTLCDNDCDVSWKEFLIERGIAPESDRQLIDHFYDQYKRGQLDYDAFVRFQLREFAGRSVGEVGEWARAHFETVVRPRVYREALERVAAQRERGELVCLATATNRTIAEPVAELFGFAATVSTEPEVVDSTFTGAIVPPYCCGAGKAEAMAAFGRARGIGLDQIRYYGDSVSDIPIFEVVGDPVVVNPGDPLRTRAAAEGWPVLDFARP